MRWTIFVLAALLALAIDCSVARLFSINSEGSGIWPGVTAALAVFITLSASRLPALWACLLLGLLVDLSEPRALPESLDVVYVLGPFALGYVFAAYVVFQLRTFVFRRRALTIGFLTAVFYLVAALAVIAIFTVRGWYAEPLAWKSASAGGELVRRFFMALYSGLFAIPVGWLLLRSSAAWGFHTAPRHRSWR